ncbi:MAG: selenoneine biosynthesis selenosugar synthase SenB [Verrucomicrobiota bacterium]
MKILIVSPGGELQKGETRTGNRSTASQWGRLLKDLGHDVEIAPLYRSQTCDILIALHGKKSKGSMDAYREENPDGKLILGLAGTDIYPKPDKVTLEAASLADAIIGLQDLAPKKIPKKDRDKVHVIRQSATPCQTAPEKDTSVFTVSVLGHLRQVKDPLLLAQASRLLPPESKVLVVQAGDILEEAYEEPVEEELVSNPRYRYFGELNRESTSRLIAASDLMCLTSINEGGARVVGEAIVNQTPVLSTKMDGSIGLLGADYPGYFPVGDAEALSDLLTRCETDPEFLSLLRDACVKLAPLFSPECEKEGLDEILSQVTS